MKEPDTTYREQMNEYFYCNKVKNNTIFPLMKDIDSMRNLKTNNFKKFKITLKEVDSLKSKIFIDGHTGNEFLNIKYQNDSILLEDSTIQTNLFVLNKKYYHTINFSDNTDTIKKRSFSFWDYNGSLEHKYFDKKCRDTIYIFKYNYNPPSGVSQLLYRDLLIKEITFSKERGILKILLKDINGEIWEAKYFNE